MVVGAALSGIDIDASRLSASQSSGSRASRFLRISGAGQYQARLC